LRGERRSRWTGAPGDERVCCRARFSRPKVGGERARSKGREVFFTQQLRKRLDESYFLTGSGCLWSEEREKEAIPWPLSELVFLGEQERRNASVGFR